MTIEEKAKAYDKALESAKSCLKDDTITNTAKSYIEEIFPELKESREEKIRKLLIRLFTSNTNEKFDDVSTEEIIAWLEKQAPIDEERIVKGVRRGVAMSLMDYIDENTKGMCLSNMECEDIENAVVDGDWGRVYRYMKKKVEKQGEQKETLCDKCKKTQPSHSCQDITELGRCAVEHEQKPANEVEPKFHEGQWITNGDYTWKIVEVRPLDYILKSQDGNIVDDTISHVDEQFHSFTIEDAKDGDILVTNKKQPFIFNGHYDEDTDYIYGYCGICDLVKDDSFYINEENVEEECNVWCVNENVYPATKEQCDILFSKMKDAGYEWDAEKKEPKKIEEKSTEWYEKTKGLDELEKYIFSIVPNRPLDAIKVDSKNIRFLINKEQKHWSEDDYNKIKSIKYLLHELDNHNFDDWFDSLKCEHQYNKPYNKPS